MLLFLGIITVNLASGLRLSPHQPQNCTWEVRSTKNGNIIIKKTTPEDPIFNLDLCDILQDEISILMTRGGKMLGSSYGRYGCGSLSFERGIRTTSFYMCPSTDNLNCNGDQQYHCASWGCETIAPWTNHDNFLEVTRTAMASRDCHIGKCNPIRIIIKRWRPQENGEWELGRTWGLRLYVTGTDPGTKITIQKYCPKHVQNPIRPIRDLDPGLPPVQPPVNKVTANNVAAKWTPAPTTITLKNPLLVTLDSVFNFLNTTSPNLTVDCWLCLNPEPPYYVGIGANISASQIRNISTKDIDSSLCPWGSTPRLTLGDLQGQGLCYRSAKFKLHHSPYKSSCSNIIVLNQASPNYLIPPKGVWFACTSGMTPCLNIWTITSPPSPELCIAVHIIPQVYYYSGEGGTEHFETMTRFKRAPILVPILATIGIAGSTAIGTSALIIGDQNFKFLSSQIDRDLAELEKLVSKLEESLSSLAEVVLQNRRGLDLLFLKQGGLCMALGETCCFYTNHSGVIKDSLSLIRKRLKEREETRQKQENWYERLFTWSPWLTTLVGTIIGPLIVIFGIFLIAPCVVNCASRYIQQRIQSIKVMLLHTQYDQLTPEDIGELEIDM